MRDPKSSFVHSARGHRQAPRWLQALCLSGALLAFGPAAQAGAPGTLVVLGSHVDAGSASFEKDVKAAARTALERKDDQWHLSFVAYLKKPPGAEEVSLVFYDNTPKREYINSYTIRVKATAKIVLSEIDLKPEDGFKAGNKYQVLITRLVGGKEDIFARSVVELKGPASESK